MHQLTNKQWEIWQPQYKLVPLMRSVLSLMLGIFISGYFNLYFNFLYLIIILFFILGLTHHLTKKRISEGLKVFYGILVFVFFFVFGFQLIYLSRSDLKSSYFGNFWKGKMQAKIQIMDIPKSSNSYYITRAKVLSVGRISEVSGELYVLIKSSDFKTQFKNNDILEIEAQLTEPIDPVNPYQFNFKKYLFNKHLYHQIFIQKENLISKYPKSKLNLYEYIKSIREKLVNQVKEYDFSKSEFSVANALLFGYSGDISDELLSVYSGTGVVHILSVSGLHVGIIFLVINFILQWLDPSMTTRFRHFIIVSIVLWIYAMLSGMSPSIVRAVVMFSLLKLFDSINFKMGSFHAYFACLFVMLVFDANYLFDVGFQLSFLAVYGILYFQPKFKIWFDFKKRWQLKLFELLSVTIAAQITTIPITLYYFHQFPTYFFITNLVIVPVSSIVMMIGLIFVLTSWIPHIGNLIFILFKYSILFMNKLVSYFEMMPYSTIKGVYFDTSYLVISSIIIISLIFFLERRSLVMLNISFYCLICIFLSEVIQKYLMSPANSIIFYSSNEGLVAEHYEGRVSNFYYEKISSTKGTFEKTFLHGNRINSRIQVVNLKPVNSSIHIKDHVFNVGGKRLLIIDSMLISTYQINKPIYFDIVYLKYYNKRNGVSFFDSIKSGLFILDKKMDYRAKQYIKNHYAKFNTLAVKDLRLSSYLINL